MAYIAKVDDKEFKVELEKEGNGFKVYIDNKPMKATVVEVGSNSHLSLIVDNKSYDVIIEDENTISVDGERFKVSVEDEQVQALTKLKPEITHVGEVKVTAPMPGLVIEVGVKPGDTVKAGSGLLIVEAMKMQNEMKAPRDGLVKQVLVKQGMTVNGGDTLVIIE
ncbi:MAG: biotin/lipoyl-binding protein [bacterium]|nr:biotin/lipoyl-binding protein [bacterium]